MRCLYMIIFTIICDYYKSNFVNGLCQWNPPQNITVVLSPE